MINVSSKYSIHEELGRGSFGIVYKAEHLSLRRTVAIKVLSGEYACDTTLKKRFLLEARLAAALSHENLAVIYDFGENSDGIPFIVMEYVGGYSLREVARGNRLMPQRQKLEIAEQICCGLRVVHANKIIHRDIKPANVMIRDDGRVKILDFGIAKALSGELNSQVTIGTVGTLGTINYMSPEQTRGDSIDHRSDIFSFGVLLYEMVTRRVPFQGSALYTRFHNIQNDQPLDIDPEDLSEFPEIKEIIWKCLEKSPEVRYQSISEVGNALRESLGMIPYADAAETDFASVMAVAEEEATVTAGSSGAATSQDSVAKQQQPAFGLNKISTIVALLLIAGLAGWFWLSPDNALHESAGERQDAETGQPTVAGSIPAVIGNDGLNGENGKPVEILNTEELPPDESPAITIANSAAPGTQPVAGGKGEPANAGKRPAGAGKNSRETTKSAALKQAALRASADSLRVVAEQFRLTKLEMIAADSSGSFFSAAIRLETAGQEHLAAGRFSRSDSVFQQALQWYRRGLQEQIQFENAQNLIQRADYAKALSGLQALIDARGAEKPNAALLELSSRARESQERLDNTLTAVRAKEQQQDLRGALDMLEQLRSMEQNLPIVQTHRESILNSDRQVPQIAPDVKKDYDPKQPLILTAAFSDNLALISCGVNYRLAGKGEFERLEMYPGNDGRYEALLPVSTHKGRDIEYFFYAVDPAGNAARLDNGNGKPFIIKRREKLYIPRAP